MGTGMRLGTAAAAAVTLAACTHAPMVETTGGTLPTRALGVPVYPHAKARRDGTVTSATDENTTVITGFKTADAFGKVEAFYKARLPAGSETMNLSSGNGSVAAFDIGRGTRDEISVQVTQSRPHETDILITRVVKRGAKG
jgi:hypothetical protein